jgi:hypothetical protein
LLCHFLSLQPVLCGTFMIRLLIYLSIEQQCHHIYFSVGPGIHNRIAKMMDLNDLVHFKIFLTMVLYYSLDFIHRLYVL